MDRLFRFDMYPNEFMLDTADLTPDECGVYTQIIMMIYAKRKGWIYNDPDEIGRKLYKCSPRLARSIIHSLTEKGKISISDEKITQKRAENELNMKRTHLQHSANGGRTSGETKRKSKENNDLVHSGKTNSLRTPTPTPLDSKESLNPDSVKEAARGSGSEFKKSLKVDGVRGSGSEFAPTDVQEVVEQVGVGERYRVALLLDPAATARARDYAPTTKITELYRIYDENINSGKMAKPNNPNAAFPAWAKRYEHGKTKNQHQKETTHV